MAEEILRRRQYEYKSNSNIVIQGERDPKRSREPTGEVESLWGRMGESRMGDRAGRTRPGEEQAAAAARSKHKRATEEVVHKKRARKAGGGGGGFVLTASSGLAAGATLEFATYRPKTKETRTVYEELLTVIKGCIGDQPQEFLCGAAEEILAIIKDDNVPPKAKQSKSEELVGRLTADTFNKITTLAAGITDFLNVEEGDGGAARDEGIDEELGVSLVLDNEDDAGSELDEIQDSDASDEEEGDEAGMADALRAGMDDGPVDDGDELAIPIAKIDAFWLQRELSKYYEDATVSQRVANDVLSILQLRDARECETRLVLLLEYDKFDFIKVLLHNRASIAYMTRYRQAQSADERAAIEAEMAGDVEGGGAAILGMLHEAKTVASWAQDRAGQFQDRVRREARQLGRLGGAAAGAADEDGMPAAGGDGDGDVDMQRPKAVPRTIIDLEALEFSSGSHLNSAKKVELPPKSWRHQEAGYEEVHVPALHPANAAGEVLVQIEDMPTWAQPAFEGMKALNRVQSRLYKQAFTSAENLLLCAPTGAGKTNVAVLTILQAIGMHRDRNGDVDLSKFKIVYIAPMKALVQECVLNFSKRFASYGMVVKELSGDQNLTKQEIAETQIIVTTPEKWDIITRKAGDRTYTQLVRLIIIDEIHLLHDERGAVLESIVARTMRQVETTQEQVRIVGLSATLPNYVDVATFLRVDPSSGLFFFDNSFRPCPLQQQYIGITEKKPYKRFMLMNEVCFKKVLESAGQHQILVFVHSRKETAKTARYLRDAAMEANALAKFVQVGSASANVLAEEAKDVNSDDLKELLPSGFAIHHAGMTRKDRTLVEDLFADKHIQVLVSTATLAWGVNLPAHRVIIKGTQIYNPEAGGWTELSPLDVMQMLGRAGRPQYDSYGEGVIITSHTELQFYLSLMNQQLPIESQLMRSLADQLNAEIVLGTVGSVQDAAEWLGYTYLFVRMKRNPSLYGVTADMADSDPLLLQRRLDMVHSAAVLLDKHGLIKYDRRTGLFQVTPLGRVASYYYVSHASMAKYNEYLKPSMSDIELFRLFALSAEFKNVVVREEEKIELTRLVDRVPIPIKESIEEKTAKINVLLQAYISQLKLEGYALMADMVYVTQSAGRIMRALFEICLRRGWASLARKALTICQMIDHRMWLSHTPLRQFPGVPADIIKKLERNNTMSFQRYLDMEAADLGELMRKASLGKKLYTLLHQFPKVELQAHIQPVTRSLIRVDVTITPDFQWDTSESSVHGAAMAWWLLVEDVDGENILHWEPFVMRQSAAGEESTVTFTVPVTEPLPPAYFVRLISDRWLHASTTLPISFRNLILPAKFAPPTELLDLQPLPIRRLQNRQFQELYQRFQHFNPVQTQTFSALFESDDNVLVAAPAGTGKTVCAEFAVMRFLAKGHIANRRIVYIAPFAALAKERFEDWAAKFGEKFDIPVVELTGEAAADVKLVDAGRIIVATPSQWDQVSRRWRTRASIRQVGLFIVDEVHMIGGADGPVLEAAASRMRFISFQNVNEKPALPAIRIVALGASMANAKDVGDWLDVSDKCLFNFHPSVRPVPLEIITQPYDVANFAARLSAMARRVYTAMAGHTAPGKPGMVFVPSKKQTTLTAIDLVTFAAADKAPHRFVGKDAEALPAIASSARDPVLRHTLAQGVGFLFDGMHAEDSKLVRALYEDGILLVVVVSHTLAWGLTLSCHALVIMDTQYFDAREHRYVDYPVTDLLQMMGRASRQGIDKSGVCVLLCQASRKEYLKRFMVEALPVESHLDHSLADHMNAEIVNGVVRSKQEAVDYVTWSFYYRRLPQNPNYYNLQGVTHRHLSDHLSELVETTLTDLESSRCISVVDDDRLEPVNLGFIAAYYYIDYRTVEVFASSINSKIKLKGLLEILCSASEFSSIGVRHHEEHTLRIMAKHLPVGLPTTARYDDTPTKINILLQCHFSREKLPAELQADLNEILPKAVILLAAMVDVIGSSGWLKPAMAVMELSQMVVQGLWTDKSPLLQLPHFTQELVDKCSELKVADDEGDEGSEGEGEGGHAVESIIDFMSLEDEDRSAVLADLSKREVADIATFCNRFPNIDLGYHIEGADALSVGGFVRVHVVVHGWSDGGCPQISMTVALRRDSETEGLNEGAGLGAVHAPRYPAPKSEAWWLVIGDPSDNSLKQIKRVSFGRETRVQFRFDAPEEAGEYRYMLYLICDSYLGCDQEYEIEFAIAAATEPDDDAEMDEGAHRVVDDE